MTVDFLKISIAAAVAVVLAAPVWAQTSKSDRWTVSKLQRENSGEDFCFAESPDGGAGKIRYQNYRPGAGNKVRGDRGAGLLQLIVGNVEAVTVDEEIASLVVTIGDNYKRSTRGSWQTHKDFAVLTIPVEDYVDEFIRPIGAGRELSVKIVNANKGLVGKAFALSLGGSYEAMIEFEKCLSQAAN